MDDDALFDDTLFEGEEVASSTEDLHGQDDNFDESDVFDTQVLANLDQVPTAHPPVPIQAPVLSDKAQQEEPQPIDANPFNIETWDEPPLKRSLTPPDVQEESPTKKAKLFNEDELPLLWDQTDLAEAPEACDGSPDDDDSQALFEDAEATSWIPPPRYPDVPCNRLSKAKLDECFEEVVDLKEVACHNLEPDETPVCCACLLDLFDEDDEDDDVALDAIKAEEPSDPEVEEGRRGMRVRRRKPPPVPKSDLEPRPGEHIGLLTSCLHMFHAECIYKWTKTENACCQCKQRFGGLAYYNRSGARMRAILIKKTLQSLSRQHQLIAEEAEEQTAPDTHRCQVCHRVGDKESLMVCAAATCDSQAHWYCLNLEEKPSTWKCQDCNRPQPRHRQPVPQPSRRRGPQESGGTRTAVSAAQQRRQRVEARLHAELNSIAYENLQNPVTPVARLLPSEMAEQTKSRVDDLILGTVPLRELEGRTKVTRSQVSVKKAPPCLPMLRPLASKPGVTLLSSTVRKPSTHSSHHRSNTHHHSVSPTTHRSSTHNHTHHHTHQASRLSPERHRSAPDRRSGAYKSASPQRKRSASPAEPDSTGDDSFFDPTSLSLTSSLTSDARPSQPNEARKPLEIPKPIEVPQSKPVSQPRPNASLRKPAVKPAASLLVPKQWIQSAQQTIDKSSSNPPPIRRLRNGPVVLGARPAMTAGGAAAPRELQEVVTSLVERLHPAVMADVRSKFLGKPEALLEARMYVMKEIAEKVAPAQLVAESHRRLPQDRKAFWESSKSQLSTGLCHTPLVTNASERQRFIQSLITDGRIAALRPRRPQHR
eukprot:Blabericola_migrator_1__10942@NODE_632_length_7151_cov_76_464286_g463_i0_p1_GENE_NODE_632_length_7151_cov_76_464286_g463_i0NODE_632_length_7151_cov_76_464286_g463_i0_p1_ORF_typecomplete_len821_score141_61zfRING_2/PF13639_6/4_2e03zfRING_2/PF13639_6/4_8e06PHD/PF00628_29/1_7e03PHD/PF00628_29/8e06zfrbx1/PF12678_7/1_3e05zfANAPC11/PF12861_7/2_6e05zfANAPC11/PF12861_7/3_1e03ProkRING_4/PF14447_6/0_00039zfRING_5/PF14634_6/7_6e03zfRING_5/PF14634_6/0_00085zfRING_5/PF14634_6/3_2e03zfC3HC4_2/PF13923_6/0_0014z